MPDIELIKKGLFNDGVLPEIWPTDFHVGGPKGLEYAVVLASGDWRPYKSAKQLQWGEKGGDKLHCVSRSNCNGYEDQINYFYQTGKLSQKTIDFLNKYNYIVNGKIELHVRFLSQMSGTTKSGNSLSKVAYTGYSVGYAPSNYPAYPDNVDLTWDQYYIDPPQELKDIAEEFLKHFSIGYEWVWTGDAFSEQGKRVMAYHAKHGPIQLASALCSPWANQDGTVPSCPLTQPSHAYLGEFFDEVNKKVYAFDHYDPFMKILNWDYPLPFGLKLVTTPICSDGPKELHPEKGVGSLLKVTGKPAVYMYGLDKMWHGLGDMDVLRVFKGPYVAAEVIRVPELPSNVGFTITKEKAPAASGQSLIEQLFNIFNLKK